MTHIFNNSQIQNIEIGMSNYFLNYELCFRSSFFFFYVYEYEVNAFINKFLKLIKLIYFRDMHFPYNYNCK